MLKWFFGEKSPRFRIAIGLSGMLISLILLASILGLVPDSHRSIREGRASLAESIAVNSSIFITISDIKRMEAILQIIVERDKDLLSAAVRRQDGTALVEIGAHKQLWMSAEPGALPESHVVVPIFEGSNDWGRVELVFTALLPTAWYGEFFHPTLLLISFLSVTSFILFYWYLGKMLKQLDPSQAIPDRVRSALDTMAEGLLVLDAKQNIVMANLAFSSIANEDADKLIGRKIYKFPWMLPGDKELDRYQAPWFLTLGDGNIRTADMIRLKVGEGDSKTFMANCSPVLTGGGKPAGVLISFDDVTELEQKEIELMISKDQAEQANRFKSEFLANMSHEIRTPMNAILGFTEVLKRGFNLNSSDSIKYLNTISSSGNHLLNLINDILDLSKVESGQIDVEIIKTSVHQIIHEVIQIMRVKADEKNIEIHFRPSGPLPDYIFTDSGKLRQIVTNLVGNAIKFTDQGQVIVTTEIATQLHSGQIKITISDTGIGMTQEQAESVFNPFTQADSSITRRFGGTGLGLTISKRFSEALGGDIKVESEPGKGSDFIVTLDTGDISQVEWIDVDQLLVNEFMDASTTNVRWQFPDARVLVVDDGEENRELLSVVLSEYPFEIETAENGLLALQALERSVFDVVLMDVQMSVMDGYTAAGKMRERGYTGPIIAMTADAMLGVEQKCLDAGYSIYMTKPVQIDLLLERLSEVLGGEQVTETPAQETLFKPTVAEDEHKTIDDSLIYSTLPTGNEKFRSIVENFITRVKQQLELIDLAYEERDYPQLQRLGHWLKGSSGSVGFSPLVEPAVEFEQCAIDKDDVNLRRMIALLHQLCARLRVSSSETAVNQAVASNPKSSTGSEAASNLYSIPQVVECRLDDKNPRMRKVIDRFVRQLNRRLLENDQSIKENDFDAIHKFAYWIKASGGSVGFDIFTLPAEDLGQSASDQNMEHIKQIVDSIRIMADRISLSG